MTNEQSTFAFRFSSNKEVTVFIEQRNGIYIILPILRNRLIINKGEKHP
jgi:hypothetical protein